MSESSENQEESRQLTTESRQLTTELPNNTLDGLLFNPIAFFASIPQQNQKEKDASEEETKKIEHLIIKDFAKRLMYLSLLKSYHPKDGFTYAHQEYPSDDSKGHAVKIIKCIREFCKESDITFTHTDGNKFTINNLRIEVFWYHKEGDNKALLEYEMPTNDQVAKGVLDDIKAHLASKVFE
jgi:hypothetical protein